MGGQASEGSFHKKEQEYALSQLRKKLVKEGKLSAEVLLGRSLPPRPPAQRCAAR